MPEPVLMLVVGVLIGGVLGALGGGGSILAVPALVYVGHQSAQAATSASLVVVGIGAMGGMLSHLRARRVRLLPGLGFGLVGIAGSFAGTRLNRAISEDALLAAFAVMLLVVAVMMVARSRRGTMGPDEDHQVRPFRVIVAGTLVGFLTGFLGVGGGFVVVPALVLSLGYSMPIAVGTSLVVISVNAAAGLVARAGALDIPWAATMALAAGTMAGSAVGARIAGKVNARVLTQAFAGLLLVLGGYIGVTTLMG